MASGAPVVLAGDYNVVPTPQDIYRTRSLDNNALIQPASRQAFARLLAQGWTDALRKLHPDGPLWTFWDYKFERWQKDKGMRLDHFLLSPNLSDRLVDGGEVGAPDEALALGNDYPYGIMADAERISGGVTRLQTGTLYMALDRLRSARLVEPDREEVADGRLRRYYRLTDEGAALLGAETERRRASAAVAAQRLRARLAGGTA